MKARSLMAIVIFLVVILFAAQGVGYILGAQDASADTAGGLNTAAGYNIATEVSAVWGLENGTWHAATLSPDASTGTLTVTFALGVHPSQIVVQTDNSSQSAWKLLNKNNVYTDFQLGTSNMVGNVSSVTMYFGQPVNDSATTSVSDKGVKGYDVAIPIFSNSVNHLGKNIQVSPDYMLDSFPTTMPQYVINVHNNTIKNTSVAETFTITQNFEYTAHYPLVTEIFLSALVLDTILAYLFYRATPESYGSENMRVVRFQNKHERRAAIEGVSLLAVSFLVIGIMGDFSNLWGWGGAIAFTAGFGLAAMVYTSDPRSHSYGRAILVGFIGGALLLGVNLYIAFGTTEYNALYSGSFLAAIQAVVFIGLMLAATYVGIVNTKKVHLRERE